MEETGFFTRLFVNPTDGAIFESAAHVAVLSVGSMLVYEWFGLREKLYKPMTQAIGGGNSQAPMSRRLAAPAPRGGM